MKILKIILSYTILFILPCYPCFAEFDSIDEGFSLPVWNLSADVQKTITIDNDEMVFSPMTKIFHDQTSAVIRIYGQIMMEDVALWNDLKLLEKKQIKKVHVYLNSPGGYVLAAYGIIGAFKEAMENGFEFEITASTMVASAAVPIFLIFDNRHALDGTIFMVHQLKSEGEIGSYSEYQSSGILLDIIRDQYHKILMNRTKIKDIDQWVEWERDTKWFTVDEAVEIGILPEAPK